MASAVGYIRVSSTSGKDTSSDSFITVDLQREAIASAARRYSYEVVEVIEEINASGGDSTRKGWNRALAMVEKGDVSAILVYNLARFSRSLKDATASIERIEQAGGSLVSEQDGLFDSSPSGSLQRNLLFSVAEFERRRQGEAFKASVRKAVEKGIAIMSVVPFGYERVNKRLVPNPQAAPLVVEAFEMKAAGMSRQRIATWLVGQGHPITDAGVAHLLKNRCYLGEIRSKPNVKLGAHEAIVTPKLFEKAQAVRGKRVVGDGSLTGTLMLQGICTCSNCGGTLSGLKSNRGQISYYCRSAQHKCEVKACILARDLEREVETRVLDWIHAYPSLSYIVEDGDNLELDEARVGLEIALYNRDRHISDTQTRNLIGDGAFYAHLEQFAAKVAEAQKKVDELSGTEKERVEFPLVSAWSEWSIQTKREYLSQWLKLIVVLPVGGKRGVPVTERVIIKTATGSIISALEHDWDGPSNHSLYFFREMQRIG